MKEAARFFKVLADESRLKMLWLLFNRRELCVCDVMAVLEITQSKASRHLAALRNAGIAADRKEGLWSYYSLLPPEDRLMKEHMRLLKTSLSRRTDAKPLIAKLDAWLKEKKSGETCIKSVAHGSTKIKARSIKTSFAGETR